MLATESLIYKLAGYRFVIETFDGDPDHYGGQRAPHVETITFTEALERIRRDNFRWGHDHCRDTGARLPTFNKGARMFFDWCREAAAAPNPVTWVCSALTEGDCPMNACTEREYKKRQAAKERAKLESLAVEFAGKHHVAPGTMEFLEALHREAERVSYRRERWNDGETRMEEWAAHRYAGSTEAYFDDLNFENLRFDHAEDDIQAVIDWVRKTCPLLYMQFMQFLRQRLREGKGGN